MQIFVDLCDLNEAKNETHFQFNFFFYELNFYSVWLMEIGVIARMQPISMSLAG